MSRVREFPLPDLGEGLTEGEILKWLVAVGDSIALNQPIVEVETAKAAVEIPAKWAGRVQAIFHSEGETVNVGTPIIAIDTEPDGPALPAGPAAGGRDSGGGEAGDGGQVEVPPPGGAVEPGMIGGPAPGGRTAVLVGYGPKSAAAKRRPRVATTDDASAATVTATAADTTAATEPRGASGTREATGTRGATGTSPPGTPAAVGRSASPPAGAAAPSAAAPSAGPALAKPPVRKLAKDLGINLNQLAGTGPAGSITREDVQSAASDPVAVSVLGAPGGDGRRERRIPVKGVRKLTAENMVASAFTAPHVTEFLTVDVTRSMKALDRLRALPEWRDARVSPLLMVAKAVLMAIPRHPMVNSSWAGDEIVVKEYVNLGIAAATERGLIVPCVADAHRLSLRELADALTDLVQTAKAGRTAPSDLTGGTFTITNVGVFGVDTGTPILPPGEVAILALGQIRQTPWVHKGKVRPRQVTTLGLSFDHRVVDGELGSKFLQDVGQFLTDPESALLAWA